MYILDLGLRILGLWSKKKLRDKLDALKSCLVEVNDFHRKSLGFHFFQGFIQL